MNKYLLKHLNYYLCLVTIFAAGLALSLLAYPNLHLEIAIIIATIVLYVCWGIWHHKRSHELTNKLLVEYILIGLLGISIVFFVFMGGLGI